MKRIVSLLLLLVLSVFGIYGCSLDLNLDGTDTSFTDTSTEDVTSEEDSIIEDTIDSTEGTTEQTTEEQTTEETTEQTTEEQTTEQTTEEQTTEETTEEELIDEDGLYTSKDDVALYISVYGKLPSNYMTKSEVGGHISKIWTPTNKASVGGDIFQNREGYLPKKTGRIYYECDIDYKGASTRGQRRIVFSNDGLIFYTGNHYDSFVKYEESTGRWTSY